jgi:hypothetical protein
MSAISTIALSIMIKDVYFSFKVCFKMFVWHPANAPFIKEGPQDEAIANWKN